MKIPRQLLTGTAASLLALGLLATAPSTAFAAVQTWNNAGPTNIWSINPGDTNWTPGNVTWTNGNDASFTNAVGETITIGTDLEVASISFGVVSGAYTFNNGANTIDITGAGVANSGLSTQTISSSGVINFTNAASAGNNTSIVLSNSGGVTFSGTATAGGANLSINTGQISFSGSSSAGSSTIASGGIVEFLGTSTGGTANISSGGTVDISGHTGNLSLGSLSNSAMGSAGAVILGSNKLTVGNLTLAALPGNLLDFTLFTSIDSGAIIVGSNLIGAGAGQVTINITPGAPTLTSSVYDLLDWTTATAAGVDISDFVLTSPGAYAAGYSLRIDPNTGKKLQLVQSVPDGGNTFFLFGAAVLGLGFIAHRRKVMA